MQATTIKQLLDFDHQFVWHPYSKLKAPTANLLVESAQGCTLTLADGRQLIDGMSSWWAAIHGYNHPVLNHALIEQSQKMSHVMFGGLSHQPAIELAQLLQDITPPGLDYTFFSDSGSVCVEVAIKMALQYWQGHPQSNNKNKLLTVRGGYHGDTFGCMSVCDPVNGMHHLFNANLMSHFFAPRPEPVFGQAFNQSHIHELRQLCTNHQDQIAALIIEPIVQGAGGMYFYSAEYLKQLRLLCDEFNILLIADEIATGFARSGTLFACEHAQISPDIMCVGKGLTGGYMTLAATLCNAKVAQGIDKSSADVLMHGPTFMANPLACSVALSSIKLLLETDWKSNIARIEQALTQGLAALKNKPGINDVRILGAIGVVELTTDVDMQTLPLQLIKRGIWLRPFGKLVYIMPPYIISNTELELLCHAVVEVLTIQN